MRTKWALGYGLAALFLAVAAPLATAAVPPLPGEEPPSGGDPTDPEPTPAVDPQKILDDAAAAAGDGDDSGGGVAPAPPGSGNNPGIGDEIGSVIAENWVLSASIAAGILGTTVAGWLLASRYVDPKVALENPQRSMLYGFVKGNPGVHLKQLSSEFHMKTSTVLWHVRKLEAAELVRSKKANGYRVFYPVSGGIEASRVSEAVTALSNANARRIYAHFAASPIVDVRAMPDALAINAGTVRWHIKKLLQAGLLEAAPTPGNLQVTELGVKALRQVQGLATPMEVASVGAPLDAASTEESAIYQ